MSEDRKLKNYTSRSINTFGVIQHALSQHKARQLVFDYEDDGRVQALVFALEINGRPFHFRLPARVENVETIMYGRHSDLSDKERDQAYRTAWANIRDWIVAQLALIDTGMVKAEEVFLPYMLTNDGETLYEAMRQSKFLLPGSSE